MSWKLLHPLPIFVDICVLYAAPVRELSCSCSPLLRQRKRERERENKRHGIQAAAIPFSAAACCMPLFFSCFAPTRFRTKCISLCFSFSSPLSFFQLLFHSLSSSSAQLCVALEIAVYQCTCVCVNGVCFFWRGTCASALTPSFE